ncbi:matrixin family metalloprotease [Paenibacillus endophyticus]
MAAHEMRHALGLKHYPGSLMDESICGQTTTTITTDNIAGIRSIY